MKILKRFKQAWATLTNEDFETRSRPPVNMQTYAVSAWHDIPLEKAVDEGFLKCVDVFISIETRSQLISTIPLYILDNNGKQAIDHPLTRLLNQPNAIHSMSEIIKLIVQWYDLVGDAYIFKSQINGQTQELWAISPIEIAVRQKKDGVPGEIEYIVKNTNALHPVYTPDNMIRIYYPNPANMVTGISPLEVVGSQVDISTLIAEYNQAQIQSKGVLDFIVEYPENVRLSAPQLESLQKRLDALLSGKHTTSGTAPIDMGGHVVQLSKTGEELGFRETSEASRDKIFNAYGGTRQIYGYEIQSYAAQRDLIRWFMESKIIPLAQLIVNALNRSLRSELGEGYSIELNLGAVKALRESEQEKTTVAKTLWDMGVPFDLLNAKFDFGFTAFEGSALPYGGKQGQALPTPLPTQAIETPPLPAQPPTSFSGRGLVIHNGHPIHIRLRNDRDFKKEAEEFEQDSIDLSEKLRVYFKHERVRVKEALTEGMDVREVLDKNRLKNMKFFSDLYAEQAVRYGLQLIQHFPRQQVYTDIQVRINPVLFAVSDAIRQYLANEDVAVFDGDIISENTKGGVADLVQQSLDEGWGITKLKEKIDMMEEFSPERALTVARTMNGTARSMGQIVAAKTSGAQMKKWESSGDMLVRDTHRARDNMAAIGIEETWNNGKAPMRYPNDPMGVIDDRVNCRCAMSYQ